MRFSSFAEGGKRKPKKKLYKNNICERKSGTNAKWYMRNFLITLKVLTSNTNKLRHTCVKRYKYTKKPTTNFYYMCTFVFLLLLWFEYHNTKMHTEKHTVFKHERFNQIPNNTKNMPALLLCYVPKLHVYCPNSVLYSYEIASHDMSTGISLVSEPLCVV